MYVSEMFDQLRDLLNDADDSQVPFATKKLYLNAGIRRLWPRVRAISSETVAVVAGVTRYSLSAALSKGLITGVEYTLDSGSTYAVFEDWDLVDGDDSSGAIFCLMYTPSDAFDVLIHFAAQIGTISAASYVAAQAEAWTGPDHHIHLPVYYAMAMIAARKLDDRQDTNRYSTTQALNGVGDTDLMTASQFWMGQFEAELGDGDEPLPISKD